MNEKEFISIIREAIAKANDPAKVMEDVTEMLTRCVAGESVESIAASYGIVLEEVSPA